MGNPFTKMFISQAIKMYFILLHFKILKSLQCYREKGKKIVRRGNQFYHGFLIEKEHYSKQQSTPQSLLFFMLFI